jgi:hypothetical protein
LLFAADNCILQRNCIIVLLLGIWIDYSSGLFNKDAKCRKMR